MTLVTCGVKNLMMAMCEDLQVERVAQDFALSYPRPTVAKPLCGEVTGNGGGRDKHSERASRRRSFST